MLPAPELSCIQAERIHDLQIGGCSVARFDDDAEATAVFPHSPADVVPLKRGADIADPSRRPNGPARTRAGISGSIIQQHRVIAL
jgi:hypothetical protein